MIPQFNGLQRKLRLINTTREVVGAWQTIRLACLRVLTPSPADRFDEIHSVDTQSELDPSQAFLPDGDGGGAEKYSPTHSRVLRHILRHLDVDYPSTTFVDIGCGKGRAVLLATQFPFRKVVGVELSPVTSTIARKNLEVFVAGSEAKCADVEILNRSALEYVLPNDSDVAFYLFHPFNSEILERFVEHVADQVRQPGRSGKVSLAYSMLPPEGERVLARSPDLRKARDFETLSGIHSWSLWEFGCAEPSRHAIGT